MRDDSLLRPYRLKHLVLMNRIISTAHEPDNGEDGLKGERYRLCHRERTKGGVAMTMTAGSAVVSPDSPAAFGNLSARHDRIAPLLARIAADCHEEGCAVREPAHRAEGDGGGRSAHPPLCRRNLPPRPAL